MALLARAVPGFALSGLALLLIREPPRVLGFVQPPAWPLFARLLRSRAFVRLMLGMGLGVLSGVEFGNWGPTLFVRSFALSQMEAGSTFGLYFGLSRLVGAISHGLGDSAGSLRLGLSVAIPLGFAGALLLLGAATHLEADRATLADL